MCVICFPKVYLFWSTQIVVFGTTPTHIHACYQLRDLTALGFNIVVLSFINLNRPLGIMQNKSNYMLVLKGETATLLRIIHNYTYKLLLQGKCCQP